MRIIETTKDLKDFCKQDFGDFITIDTEFLRDKTYYPLLCLVQIGSPKVEPVAVDSLAKDIDLKPLVKLLADETILKVMHAGKQDMEIFYMLMKGKLPAPVFDTQIAASVLGYGEQIAYHALVKRICNEDIDKSRQFTDWSHRPISDAQLKYAIGDVTYLIDVYKNLSEKLEQQGRLEWIKEDMQILTNPKTYANDPDLAWQRIKMRSHKKQDYVVLQALAAWREKEAQRVNIPKQRIMKDDVLTQIALTKPKDESGFKRIRGMADAFKTGDKAKNLLKIIAKAQKDIESSTIEIPSNKKKKQADVSHIVDMLKLLLKLNANEHGIAGRMIVNVQELEDFALEETRDIPMLQGWRYKVFGKEAEALVKGKLTLGLEKGRIKKSG